MSVKLLETRSCDFADYEGVLRETAMNWRMVTGRQDLTNRKDWEFVTMADFARQYNQSATRALDTACGRESLVNWLAAGFETVIATDLWEPAYLKAAGIELEGFLKFWRHLPNVFPMQADSTRLPFNDNFFDATFCVSSIEHIGREDGSHEGAERALREQIRVTKPGGLIAWSTEMLVSPGQDKWYFTKGGLESFVRRFTGQECQIAKMPASGAAEGEPICPVAFAMRKL